MKLSTRTRYATRAILEIAKRRGDCCVSVREISEKQNISFKYLERLMSKLKQNQLVKSYRGTDGGYILAKLPEEIRLIDIYESTEGAISPVGCVLNKEKCSKSDNCVTCEIWIRMKNVIEDFLSNITIQDLMDK